MTRSQRAKIVLICGNIYREFPMLQLLKKELEMAIPADVWIIGSLADVQKIYYSLNQIKPDVVFISQIVEKVTRDIASYVKKSGATLCVLPAELTYSDTDYYGIFNNTQKYDGYVDWYFLPGFRMYRDILKYSDIGKNKLFITGTPKIDLYKNKNAKRTLSRKDFLSKYSIPKKRKNVFVFTSFVTTPEDYIKKEKAFKGGVKFLLKKSKEMLETKAVFIKDIQKLCIDFPDVNIILKPHPLEDGSVYESIISNNYYILWDITFNDTVNSIDLAIHWHSTVATECWVKGIKTLQYDPYIKNKDMQSDFDKENPVYRKYSDLKKGVAKYLIQNLEKKYRLSQKKYLALYYYKTDGMSVRRIASRLGKILRQKNKKSINFYPINSIEFYLFIFAERVFGITLSRMFVSLFIKDYAWRYAADNFVFNSPGVK